MLISDWIKVKWSGSNKIHYIGKGYYYTKNGDELLVKVSDLSESCNAYILCLCDYCLENGIEKFIEKKYATYITQNEKSTIKKDSCSKCRYIKVKESNLLIHGVENVSHIPEIRRKAEDTCIDKFGFKSYMQSEEGKQRAVNICLDKYGVTNYAKTEECKEKTILTCQEKYNSNSPIESEFVKNKIKENNLDKYGCEIALNNKDVRNLLYDGMINKFGVKYYSQTEWYNEKYRNTCLLRFGVDHPFKDKNIRDMARIKAVQTLYKNGTCKTSSQQLCVYNLLKDNGYNVKLNYPIDKLSLDVALFIGIFKIDIEYDCYYWHKDRRKDRARDEVLKKEGWRILRIKSGTLVPTLEQIKQQIDYLLYKNKEFAHIVFDDWTKEYNKDMEKKNLLKQII